MATDEFTASAFPSVRYDSVRRNYDLTFYLESKPRWRFLVGGNISSTAFNQAYVGFNYFFTGVNLKLQAMYQFIGRTGHDTQLDRDNDDLGLAMHSGTVLLQYTF